MVNQPCTRVYDPNQTDRVRSVLCSHNGLRYGLQKDAGYLFIDEGDGANDEIIQSLVNEFGLVAESVSPSANGIVDVKKEVEAAPEEPVQEEAPEEVPEEVEPEEETVEEESDDEESTEEEKKAEE